MSVLASEARRASRRWSSALLRTAVPGVLLMALFIAVALSPEAQVWTTGEGGRAVFLTLRWTALAMLAFIAPTLGALGLAEERQGARLDLLVLTRIPPWRLFADKVGSRLLCGGPGDDGLNGEADADQLWGPAASGKTSGEVDALFCGTGTDTADTVSTGTTTCTAAERTLTTAPADCD